MCLTLFTFRRLNRSYCKTRLFTIQHYFILNHFLICFSFNKNSPDVADILVDKNINSRAATLTTTESVLLYKKDFNRQGKDFPLYIIPERQMKQYNFFLKKIKHYKWGLLYRLFNQQMAYAFPKNSPMPYLFNDVIVWLNDCGIIDQVLERNSPYRSVESQVKSCLSLGVFRLFKCEIFCSFNCCLLGLLSCKS